MCDMNLRLVAWIDGELPDDEGVTVEQHVQSCAECRQSVAAYKAASGDFAGYYAAATQLAPETQSPRKMPRWIPLAVAAAAAVAVVAFVVLLRTPKQTAAAPAPQSAKVTTPVAPEPTADPVEQAQPAAIAAKRRPVPRRNHLLHEDWAIGQPAIQIAIPADSVFPPGAVPEGVAYIANVSFAADGSVQGFRLHQ
jgi:anti-sigma factor RsiW